jgi:hypothetical protein
MWRCEGAPVHAMRDRSRRGHAGAMAEGLGRKLLDLTLEYADARDRDRDREAKRHPGDPPITSQDARTMDVIAAEYEAALRLL